MQFLSILCCAYFLYSSDSRIVHASHRGEPEFWGFRSGEFNDWGYRAPLFDFNARAGYQPAYIPGDFGNADFNARGNYPIPDITHGERFAGVYHDRIAENAVESYQCNRNIRVTRLTGTADLGEEPFWDAESRSVYFVDGGQYMVHRYAVDTKKDYNVTLGNENVADIIPVKGMPGTFLTTYGDNLAILNWDGSSNKASFQNIRQPDPNHPWPNFFINDAKVAPNGALFFYSVPVIPNGDMNRIPRQQSTLFNIMNGHQKTLITNLNFGNGLGFSRNGEWLYYSDSLLNLTYKAYYDQRTNSIAFSNVLVNYVEKGISGRPDSLTVDKDGHVWIAVNFGSQIIKIDPANGDLLCSIQLPAVGITNLAFGECPYATNGKLECLYVTTLSRNLDTPTAFDGALLLVEGTGSEGILADRLKLSEIINNYFYK